MAKVKAKRGVCIGVENNLAVGETADSVGPATAQFLVSIGAVELVQDEPAPAPDPKPDEPAADPVDVDPPQSGKSKKAGK
jgi:hypothetical protein